MRLGLIAGISLLLSIAEFPALAVEQAPVTSINFKNLTSLPDSVGFAGGFAGRSNGALIFAGGANFPDGPPWEGNKKVWHDRIFVTTEPGKQWQEATERLPRPLAYGVSITTPTGILCIGGSDSSEHYANVFRLEWQGGHVKITDLAPLPIKLANACGALLGNTVYVAGGSESPSDTTATRYFFAFDLTTQSWTSLPTWPGPERMLAVAGAQDGSFFLISGAKLLPGTEGKPTREYLTDAYRYTPSTKKWKRIADLPHPTVAAPSPAAAIGQSHLFILGGDDGKYFFGPTQDHGGFSNDVLAYHTITNTWSRIGTIPHPPRVVTTLVPYNGNFILPSGEIRSGVRDPAVSLIVPEQSKTSFGLLNYLTLGIYPLIMLGISYFVGKKETSDEFFRGGQRIPWWAAGISIYATMLSSITYMAVPATAYATDWSFFVKAIGFLAVTPIVAYIYLPFFRQLDVTSAYEYLEKRFNLAARWFGSASFMILQLGRTAIVLYLPSLALSTVTQIDIVPCILLMGAISILMTFLGGVEAVVWTDLAQTIIFLAGIIVTFLCIKLGSGLTLGQMYDRAAADGKFFGNLTWTWDMTLATAWVIVVGNFFADLIPYTASQDVVQRYLTTRDQKQAARAILTNAALTIPFSLLFFGMGTALFVFYKQFPQRLDPKVGNDAIFPLFMVRELPAGVAGLVVAGIFAAAQPTSNLNSMATAFVTDFYQRLKPEASDASKLKWAQWLTVLFGIMGTGVALFIAALNIRSLWELFMGMMSLTGGTLAGLFALGIFSKRASGGGALIGAAVSVATLVYVYTSTKIHFFLYGAIGILTCMLAGYLASLIFPRQTKTLEGLTIFTRRIALAPAVAPALASPATS